MENIKKRKVYVVGHKNPDTDSICSAIAYAALKQQIAAVSNRIKKIKANFKTCDSVVERATRIREQLEELYNKRSEIYKRNSMCMVNGNAKDTVICGEIIKLAKYFEEHGTI